jgi:hypothetical protein
VADHRLRRKTGLLTPEPTPEAESKKPQKVRRAAPTLGVGVDSDSEYFADADSDLVSRTGRLSLAPSRK